MIIHIVALREFISVVMCFKEFDVIVCRVPMCHYWWRMPILIPIMLLGLDNLPIRHNIGILILCINVLISVQLCKLLHLPKDQAKVVDSYFHEPQFQYMVIVEQHRRHCEFSMFLEVLTGM